MLCGSEGIHIEVVESFHTCDCCMYGDATPINASLAFSMFSLLGRDAEDRALEVCFGRRRLAFLTLTLPPC